MFEVKEISNYLNLYYSKLKACNKKFLDSIMDSKLAILEKIKINDDKIESVEEEIK